MDNVIWLFGYECVAVAGRTVARSVIFSQASLSHLGETCRNRLKFTLELSLRRRALVLSEALPRSGERDSSKRECVRVWGTSLQLRPRRGTSPLGERGSPKRESVEGHYSCLSSSHLGERSSPERETLSLEQDLSTWAMS